MEQGQLGLQKEQHACCKTREVRILESVLRLEAQFSNLCEQLLTGNELQGELLRELKIYNKNRSERIKRKNLKICNKTLKSMPTNSICDQNDLAEDCVSTPVENEMTIFEESLENNENHSNIKKLTDMEQASNTTETHNLQFESETPTFSVNEHDMGHMTTAPFDTDSHYSSNDVSDNLFNIRNLCETDLRMQNPIVYVEDIGKKLAKTLDSSKQDSNSTSENVSLPPQEPENTDGKVSINFTNSAAKADDEKSDVIQVNQSQMTLPENIFACEHCNRIFWYKEALNRHMRMKHPSPDEERRYKCALCSYSTNCKKDSIEHRSTHATATPFKCDRCPKQFAHMTLLSEHYKSHFKERPFLCKICGKRFLVSTSLKMHISAVHDKLRPYACKVCGASFGQKGHVKIHMAKHSDERKYECQHCKKRFKLRTCLRSHLRLHTGERPYKCKYCSADFSDSSHVHRHVIRHHTKNFPYKCSACEKGYFERERLEKHLANCVNSNKNAVD